MPPFLSVYIAGMGARLIVAGNRTSVGGSGDRGSRCACAAHCDYFPLFAPVATTMFDTVTGPVERWFVEAFVPSPFGCASPALSYFAFPSVCSCERLYVGGSLWRTVTSTQVGRFFRGPESFWSFSLIRAFLHHRRPPTSVRHRSILPALEVFCFTAKSSRFDSGLDGLSTLHFRDRRVRKADDECFLKDPLKFFYIIHHCLRENLPLPICSIAAAKVLPGNSR